jgi:hypothetical protein
MELFVVVHPYFTPETKQWYRKNLNSLYMAGPRMIVLEELNRLDSTRTAILEANPKAVFSFIPTHRSSPVPLDGWKRLLDMIRELSPCLVGVCGCYFAYSEIFRNIGCVGTVYETIKKEILADISPVGIPRVEIDFSLVWRSDRINRRKIFTPADTCRVCGKKVTLSRDRE